MLPVILLVIIIFPIILLIAAMFEWWQLKGFSSFNSDSIHEVFLGAVLEVIFVGFLMHAAWH